MATQTPFSDFDVTKLFNPTKLFQDIKFTGLTGFDVEAVLTGQRRNIEAVTAANQLAVEGVQAVLRRQAEILRVTVEETSTVISDILAAGSPEEKVSKQAELVKSAFEKALAHLKELSEMIAKSNGEAADILNKRVSEGLDEVKLAVAKIAAARK